MRLIGLLLWVLTTAAGALVIDIPRLLTEPGRHELILHLCTAVGFALSWAVFFKGRWRWRSITVLLMACLFFPVFAPCFSMSLMLTLCLTRKMDLLGGYHEEDQAIASSLEQTVINNYEDAMMANMNVEPIVETIRGNAPPEFKRGAIETLTNICSPQSVQLLKECLHDENSEVRFYASSGLSRIEARLNERIVKYKLLHQQGDESLETLSELSKAYYEFIYLELQDRASLSYYLNQAICFFEKASRFPSAGEDVHKGLQRAYTVAGRYEDARLVHDLHFTDKLSNTNNIMYLAENFFNEGRLKECQEIIELTQKQSTSWNAVKDVQRLWFKLQQENDGSRED